MAVNSICWACEYALPQEQTKCKICSADPTIDKQSSMGAGNVRPQRSPTIATDLLRALRKTTRPSEWEPSLHSIREIQSSEDPHPKCRGPIESIELLPPMVRSNHTIPSITLSASDGLQPTIDVTTWLSLDAPTQDNLRVALGNGHTQPKHERSMECRGCRNAAIWSTRYKRVLTGKKSPRYWEKKETVSQGSKSARHDIDLITIETLTGCRIWRHVCRQACRARAVILRRICDR